MITASREKFAGAGIYSRRDVSISRGFVRIRQRPSWHGWRFTRWPANLVCGTINRMIIPQFSLRWLLGMTALCGGVSLVLAFANRGEIWALGMSAALAGIFFLFLLYVAAFCVASLITQAYRAIFGSPPTGESPFAIKPLEASPFAAESSLTASPPAISG
jgi:hypothetical protein